MALGQLAGGLAQPPLGALVDRAGAARVIVCGATLLALTTALPVGWPLPSVVAVSVIDQRRLGGQRRREQRAAHR
jgi:MFS family permease